MNTYIRAYVLTYVCLYVHTYTRADIHANTRLFLHQYINEHNHNTFFKKKIVMSSCSHFYFLIRPQQLPQPQPRPQPLLLYQLLLLHSLSLFFHFSLLLLPLLADGGVRTSFRRLVAKTLARQFGAVVEATCSPFQFALSTRAGTDCVGHAVRFATDTNPATTVLSIDGVGAYDHVFRSSQRICSRPITSGLTASEYGTTSSSTKEESKGTPSCPCSSALRFTTLWKFRNRCCRESISLLSSTTFMSFVSLIGPAKCTTFWPRNSSHEQGSSCTWARQGRGTKWGFVLPGWRTLARMFGIQRTSRFLARQWEVTFSSKSSPECVCRKRLNCGKLSGGSPMCSVHGISCCSALDLVACTVCHVREQSRRWNVDSYCPWKRGAEGHGKMSRNIANAPRRPRATIGNQDGPSRILGSVQHETA